MNKDENTTEYIESDISELEDQNENEKEREKVVRVYDRGKAMRIIAIEIFTFVVLVGAIIAWFTMSGEPESGGISMMTVGDLFSIEAVTEPGYHAGIYDDPQLSGASGTYVRDRLMSGAGLTDEVITWTITDDVAVDNSGTVIVTKGKNIGNGPATGFEGGISPGSSGVIQFVIRPNQPVNAEFMFHVYAYTGGYDEHGDEDKSTIELIKTSSGTSATVLIAEKLLNGHLLLFSDYNSETGKYSGLIDFNGLNRLMQKTYTEVETVSIYWVWPETLAEVVLDEGTAEQARNMRGKKNLCTAESRNDVIDFLKAHPDWFLLDPVNSERDWSSAISSSMTREAVITTINNNYSLYSSYYNEADQCIGTNISYILLDMAAGGDPALGRLPDSGSGSGS